MVNAKVSRTHYIPLACVGARVGSMRPRVGSVRLCVGSTRLFRYQHVGIGNTKVSRREGFGIAVEYRLNSSFL